MIIVKLIKSRFRSFFADKEFQISPFFKISYFRFRKPYIIKISVTQIKIWKYEVQLHFLSTFRRVNRHHDQSHLMKMFLTTFLVSHRLISILRLRYQTRQLSWVIFFLSSHSHFCLKMQWYCSEKFSVSHTWRWNG